MNNFEVFKFGDGQIKLLFEMFEKWQLRNTIKGNSQMGSNFHHEITDKIIFELINITNILKI